MTEEKKHDVCLDAMDAYRLARDLGIKDVKALKAAMREYGWSPERIDATCKELANMLQRHA